MLFRSEEYLAGEGAEEEASFGGSKVRGLGDGKADRADDTSESVKEPMISTRAKKTIVEAADSSSKTPVIDEDENAAKQEKGRDGVVFYKFWLLINATPGRIEREVRVARSARKLPAFPSGDLVC